MVNKHFNKCCKDSKLWLFLSIEDFELNTTELEKLDNESSEWKLIYKIMKQHHSKTCTYIMELESLVKQVTALIQCVTSSVVKNPVSLY